MRKQKRNTLKQGDKVIMFGCLEAQEEKNKKTWICATDSYDMCGSEVVFLEGYRGAFSTAFLKKEE